MTEYMFGVSHDRPTRKIARKMNTAAKKHGAYLVEAHLPGTGYQRWFCGPNRGEPFNGAMAKAVLADISKLNNEAVRS
jgi:hypothetical protein